MTVEERIAALLNADSIVNAAVAGRIYANQAARNAAYPLIVYQRISGPRDAAMDGPTGLVKARIQVTCIAATYPPAKALSGNVRAVLHGYPNAGSDDPGATDPEGVIQSCLEVDGGDIPSPAPGDEANEAFGIRSDYQVWASEW